MYNLFKIFLGKKMVTGLKKKVSKGSQGTPFLYLGLFSILLFAIICLSAEAILSSSSNKEVLTVVTSESSLLISNQEDVLSQNKQFFPESPDLLLVENCSFQASTPPTLYSPKILGALVGGLEVEEEKKAITEHVVEEGDSLYSIADKFEISLNTILWANDLNKNSVIQPGQKLIILPVDGLVHHVISGDTISGIAAKYKSKIEAIIAYNNIANESDIYIGDIVIVPEGVMPVAVSSITSIAPQTVPLADSYFICPVSSPCRITQGLHWYNAIDFSHGKCGEPIYAAAGGEVLKVKLTNSTSKWAFSGAGNHISILHPNGVVTTYGHIATSFVSPGEKVSQGQVIALMGGYPGTPGAGNSTGCHLHFGVSGARNPFTY